MKIKKLYLDMDGVLADFERGARELAHAEPLPLNGKRSPEADDRMWAAVRTVDHFYGKLELMPGAKEWFDRLYARYGDACEILTGIPRLHRGIENAREDKLEWVRRRLSKDIVVNIVLRAEKPGFCTGPDCVLIDDSEGNIRKWREAGGTGILFESPEAALAALSRLEAE